MNRCVAFLAGINVGGRRVKGAQLVAPFEELGFADVATFLASGNVVFATREPAGPELEQRIEAQLNADLGCPVRTYLRTAEEVHEVAEFTPFPPEAQAASAGKLQVGFLRTAPSAETCEAVRRSATVDDLLAVHGRQLYWLPNGGVAGSALDFRPLDAALGSFTLRTMNTVQRIAARFL